MNAVLVSYTPNPDRICAQAALVSKYRLPHSEFVTEWNDETDMRHLSDAVQAGHLSVVEHAVFTFSLEGISRTASHQLVRHRIASYTQQSQRYVELDPKADGFVCPPSIIEFDDEEEGSPILLFGHAMETAIEAYQKLLARGIPPEDARFVLPNATKTNIMVTMNARELLHFFELRCCSRAQWELRDAAWEMLRQVKRVAPLIFKGAGPQCRRLQRCPEPTSCDTLFTGCPP